MEAALPSLVFGVTLSHHEVSIFCQKVHPREEMIDLFLPAGQVTAGHLYTGFSFFTSCLFCGWVFSRFFLFNCGYLIPSLRFQLFDISVKAKIFQTNPAPQHNRQDSADLWKPSQQGINTFGVVLVRSLVLEKYPWEKAFQKLNSFSTFYTVLTKQEQNGSTEWPVAFRSPRPERVWEISRADKDLNVVSDKKDKTAASVLNLRKM